MLLRSPRSTSLTDRVLIPARSASSSWVRPAEARCRLSRAAKGSSSGFIARRASYRRRPADSVTNSVGQTSWSIWAGGRRLVVAINPKGEGHVDRSEQGDSSPLLRGCAEQREDRAVGRAGGARLRGARPAAGSRDGPRRPEGPGDDGPGGSEPTFHHRGRHRRRAEGRRAMDELGQARGRVLWDPPDGEELSGSWHRHPQGPGWEDGRALARGRCVRDAPAAGDAPAARWR